MKDNQFGGVITETSQGDKELLIILHGSPGGKCINQCLPDSCLQKIHIYVTVGISTYLCMYTERADRAWHPSPQGKLRIVIDTQFILVYQATKHLPFRSWRWTLGSGSWQSNNVSLPVLNGWCYNSANIKQEIFMDKYLFWRKKASR